MIKARLTPSKSDNKGVALLVSGLSAFLMSLFALMINGIEDVTKNRQFLDC